MKMWRLFIFSTLLLAQVPMLRALDAEPQPTPTNFDESPADYRTKSVGLSGGGTGSPAVGGTANKINAFFCAILLKVPLVKAIAVPVNGTQECVPVTGFPKYCPWPYIARVRVLIIKQPSCGGHVTGSVQGFAEDNVQVCFNVDMTHSLCSPDQFIYRLEYPRSIWGGWMGIWPGMYSRVGVVKITKQGSY